MGYTILEIKVYPFYYGGWKRYHPIVTYDFETD